MFSLSLILSHAEDKRFFKHSAADRLKSDLGIACSQIINFVSISITNIQHKLFEPEDKISTRQTIDMPIHPSPCQNVNLH